MLDYEKLDVYQCAIEHLACVFRWLPLVPRGYAALTDQWRRAAMSIPLNIAEAVGKTTIADRNNRYVVARGEAMECCAVLDVLVLLEAVPPEEVATAKQLLVRIVGMLTKLARS
jgi:four helix bundle protein